MFGLQLLENCMEYIQLCVLIKRGVCAYVLVSFSFSVSQAAKEVVLSLFPLYERIAAEIYVRIAELPLMEDLRSLRYAGCWDWASIPELMQSVGLFTLQIIDRKSSFIHFALVYLASSYGASSCITSMFSTQTYYSLR